MARGLRSEQVEVARRLRASGAAWPEVSAALQRRYGLGALKAMRLAHGWTQRDVANRWDDHWPDDPMSNKRISWWECWPVSGSPPGLPELARLAELYHCRVVDLVADLADFSHLDAYPDAVDRRSFITGAATSAALTVAPLVPAPGARIGARDVARLRVHLAELYALDDAAGGAAAFDRARDRAAAARGLLDDATYGPTVGRDLQVLVGELTEMAGWSAFDLGQHAEARRLFGEALTFATVTGSPSLATLVLASMSLQASTCGAGRDAVDLAEAAQRSARAQGSARLLSVLAAREALGHACGRDAPAAGAALHRAESLLDEEDDPGHEWLAFWGPADFQSTVAEVHLGLGSARVAERASHSAIAATPERYRRNRSLYQGKLAQALVAQGAVEEAAEAATEAASGVCPGRLRAQLRTLRPALEPHGAKPEVARCLDRLRSLA